MTIASDFEKAFVIVFVGGILRIGSNCITRSLGTLEGVHKQSKARHMANLKVKKSHHSQSSHKRGQQSQMLINHSHPTSSGNDITSIRVDQGSHANMNKNTSHSLERARRNPVRLCWDETASRVSPMPLRIDSIVIRLLSNSEWSLGGGLPVRKAEDSKRRRIRRKVSL